jgi:hypothetical protein
MEKHFPLHFTLDDGTQVTVDKTGNRLYDFTLKPENREARHFRYDNGEEFTDAKEAALDFDQLNALRKFWLLTRDET